MRGIMVLVGFFVLNCFYLDGLSYGTEAQLKQIAKPKAEKIVVPMATAKSAPRA
jgi:hypothetical protein